MPLLYENSEKIQKALLVGIDTGDFDCESSMKELYELVKSAGAEPAGSLPAAAQHHQLPPKDRNKEETEHDQEMDRPGHEDTAQSDPARLR